MWKPSTAIGAQKENVGDKAMEESTLSWGSSGKALPAATPCRGEGRVVGLLIQTRSPPSQQAQRPSYSSIPQRQNPPDLPLCFAGGFWGCVTHLAAVCRKACWIAPRKCKHVISRARCRRQGLYPPLMPETSWTLSASEAARKGPDKNRHHAGVLAWHACRLEHGSIQTCRLRDSSAGQIPTRAQGHVGQSLETIPQAPAACKSRISVLPWCGFLTDGR